MERGVYREIISTATGILAIIGLELQAFSGFLQIRGFVQFVGELVGTWWWAPIHFGLATRRPKWPKIWPICDPCVVYLYLHLAVFLGKCWYISQTWSIWVGTDKKCLRCKLLRQKVMTLTAGLMPTRLKDGPTAAAGGRIMSCYGKFIVSNSNFTLLSFFHPDFNGFHTSICLSMPFIFGWQLSYHPIFWAI